MDENLVAANISEVSARFAEQRAERLNRTGLDRADFAALAEAGPSAARGKAAISGLAEQAMTRIARVIGGSSLSRSAPFGQWGQDVRALGFLRPPWSLAYDALFDHTWAEPEER